MRILLFSEVILFEYNVSTILSPIVVNSMKIKICLKVVFMYVSFLHQVCVVAHADHANTIFLKEKSFIIP